MHFPFWSYKKGTFSVPSQGRAGEGLPISSCFFTANGGFFLRPMAAFFTVAAAVVMHGMTVGMVETARRKTRFPTVGTASHAKAK